MHHHQGEEGVWTIIIRNMARPKKTSAQYYKQYGEIIEELKKGTSYRTIARIYGVGVSTVQRIYKKIF